MSARTDTIWKSKRMPSMGTSHTYECKESGSENVVAWDNTKIRTTFNDWIGK